jgi:hypothetical protein
MSVTTMPRGAKSDKGFRKTWPHKKRKASRALRHATEILTRASSRDPAAGVEFGRARFRRQFWQLQKYSVDPLAFETARKFWRRGVLIPAKVLKHLIKIAAQRNKRTRVYVRDILSKTTMTFNDDDSSRVKTANFVVRGFPRRKFSLWKVVLVAIIIGAVLGLIGAILIPTTMK